MRKKIRQRKKYIAIKITEKITISENMGLLFAK
jgi:hypothetical protein